MPLHGSGDDGLGASYSPEMCPPGETRMRLENDLLHRLEARPRGTRGPHRMVKKFSRSAAGHEIADSEVRSPRVCLRTAQYLVAE